MSEMLLKLNLALLVLVTVISMSGLILALVVEHREDVNERLRIKRLVNEGMLVERRDKNA